MQGHQRVEKKPIERRNRPFVGGALKRDVRVAFAVKELVLQQNIQVQAEEVTAPSFRLLQTSLPSLEEGCGEGQEKEAGEIPQGLQFAAKD